MTQAIDPDDRDTWPEALREAVAPYCDGLDRDTATTDFDCPLGDDDTIELLDNRPVRAYHCTRLLPHEAEDIRATGLRPLTQDHAVSRIRAAADAGVFDPGVRDQLLAGTVFEQGNQTLTGRVNKVCAVLGLSQFSVHAHGLRPLLSSWGGEATYWNAEGQTASLLKTIGQPSIVVLDLCVVHADQTLVFPSLSRVFTACLAALIDSGVEVHHRAPIPDVVDIWQPGMPAYDLYAELPTA